MRQVMLADDDFNVDADLARASEYFKHAARRRQAALRIARDLHVHDRAIEFRQTQRGECSTAPPLPSRPTFSRNSAVNSSPGGIATSCWIRVSYGRTTLPCGP